MSTTNQIADSLEKSGIPFVRVEGVADGTEYWGLTVFHENVHAEVRECADWVETKVWNCTPEQFMNMLVGAGTCHAVLDEGYYKGINGVCEGLYCSECKEPLSRRFKYCPNCGAKVVSE